MQNDTEREWSVSGARRLENWLRKQGALTPPTEEPLSIAILVRTCAGLLTAQEAEMVEHALTASIANRERWLQIDEILSDLQQLSLREIQAISTGDDVRAQVAAAWLNAVSAQAVSLARLPQWWDRLQTVWSAGVEATAEAFTLLSAVWHRWSAMMRAPTFALARSGDTAQVLLAEGVPRDVRTIVDRFRITPEGNLSLRIILLQPDGSPASNLSGTPIAAAANLGGEIIPLARGQVSGNQYEVSLPLPATLEPLPAGELPQGYLVVALGTVPFLSGERQVRVPVETEGQSAAWAEVQGPPRCVNEQMQMRVYLPEEVRQRYTNHCLVVELRVTPTAWQKIGEWDVTQWQTGSMELTAAVPGLADGILPSTVLVRMRLERLRGCTTCA